MDLLDFRLHLAVFDKCRNTVKIKRHPSCTGQRPIPKVYDSVDHLLEFLGYKEVLPFKNKSKNRQKTYFLQSTFFFSLKNYASSKELNFLYFLSNLLNGALFWLGSVDIESIF